LGYRCWSLIVGASRSREDVIASIAVLFSDELPSSSRVGPTDRSEALMKSWQHGHAMAARTVRPGCGAHRHRSGHEMGDFALSCKSGGRECCSPWWLMARFALLHMVECVMVADLPSAPNCSPCAVKRGRLALVLQAVAGLPFPCAASPFCVPIAEGTCSHVGYSNFVKGPTPVVPSNPAGL